jgi:hypothetical protein
MREDRFLQTPSSDFYPNTSFPGPGQYQPALRTGGEQVWIQMTFR